MRQTIRLGGHHIFDLLVARRLQRFYDRIAQRQPDARAILDVGCGPGHLAAALATTHPEATVLGIDIDPVQLRLARRHSAPNLAFHAGASQNLPLPSSSQDWILATETFHHWTNPEVALAEIYRVLQPGGSFWIVEGAGDMTRAELHAWTRRRPFPGLIWWVRLIFTYHGYTTRRLQRHVLPLIHASPFARAAVGREDGWWIVQLHKPTRSPP